MQIIQIDEKQYKELLKYDNNNSFVQLSEWGELKKTTGWDQELLGFKLEDEFIGCAQMIYKSVPKTKYKIAYSAGGYSISDTRYIDQVEKELEKYLKNKKCILYKIDPQVAIQELECKNLKKVPKVKSADVEAYKALGYKHRGYLNEFEGMLPRHTIKIKTECEYEEIFAKMTSHTKRNVKTALKYKSIEIAEATKNELPAFYSLLEETSKRDKFSIREYKYFEDMMSIMPDEIRLTLAKVDLKQLNLEIASQQAKTNKEIEKAMKKEKVNEAHINGLKKQQEANLERIEEIESKINDGQTEMCLAGNLSIFDGKNGWYLFGASSSDLRFVRAVYALMNDMIKYSIENKCEYYDMFGVSGILDSDHPDYGLYKFKSGFGGIFVEFIGEFDKPLNYPLYIAFEKLYPKLKKFRKLKARR